MAQRHHRLECTAVTNDLTKVSSIKGGSNGCRLLSTRGFVPVDVEHYTSGWKAFADVKEYKPGRFQVQTFNKISPKVSDFRDLIVQFALLTIEPCRTIRPVRMPKNEGGIAHQTDRLHERILRGHNSIR